jgi:hypothetical protein
MLRAEAGISRAQLPFLCHFEAERHVGYGDRIDRCRLIYPSIFAA